MYKKTTKHLISVKDISKDTIQLLFSSAKDFEEYAKKKYRGSQMSGKVMASLFYEPSTRTRLSFETAFKRLDGDVISVTDIATSSIMKGESLGDTAKVISMFADIIVIRHPKEGAAEEFAAHSSVPVINAGDGISEHPTQALLDLYTIKKECRKIDGLNIAVSGDLRYGRCPKSLAYLLSYFDVNLRFIAPESLKMDNAVKEYLDRKGIHYVEMEDIHEGMKDMDVLYMTRIQEERFKDKSEFEKVKSIYHLDRKTVEAINPAVILLHPLPRVHEIDTDLDAFPGAAYFEQVQNGIAMRMAICNHLLNV